MVDVEKILQTIDSRIDEIDKATDVAVNRIKELQSKPTKTLDELKEIGKLHEKITEIHGRVAAYGDIVDVIQKS